MVSTDPISDMLTRIRNGIAVNKQEVSMPYSKIKQGVAELLKSNSFVEDVKVSGEGIDKKLTVVIAARGANAKITEIQRVSRPGRRLYAKAEKIPTVMRGRGIVIVSTSRGLMTGEDAKKSKVGGEVICKVY